MSYKVIEKNEYGIRVRNYSGYSDCSLCKYHEEIAKCKRLECAPNSYYLPDSEVDKLESENQLMNTTIDDLYIESKCYFEVKKKLDDTQKELIDLQIENKQLKERITELEGENEWISVENELPEIKNDGYWIIGKDKDDIHYALYIDSIVEHEEINEIGITHWKPIN